YLTGKVKVGEKTYKIALVDATYDGQIEPADINKLIGQRGRGESDLLAIDMNGDGKFSYMADGVMEVRPFTKMICLDEKYYDMKVAKDDSSLTLVKAEPKTGTLTIKGSKADLTVLGDCGVLNLPSSKGSWQLPEGRYTCQEIKLQAGENKDDKWVLETSGKTGKLQEFRIKAGETQAFEIGAPLTIKTDIQKQNSGGIFKGKEVSFGFTIVGAAGEEYSPAANHNGSQVPAPKIKIYDEKGEVLASGDFQYGGGGTCRYSWRVPKKFAGKFRTEIKPNVGPFEVKQDGENWNTID
ncbi:MAG TPA: hypothetical protein VHP11_10720, partial [Tepidisphaeraceae bacterium]|nr:hypothetical protein [Tepidisphaeraceae bacterium]